MARWVTLMAAAAAALAVGAAPAQALAPGDVVVSDPSAFGGTGGIIKVNAKTGKEKKLAANDMPVNAGSQLFSRPQGIATLGRELVVVDINAFGSSGGVIKVNPKTGKESKLSANDMQVNANHQLFSDPEGIAVDRKGKILVVEEGNSTMGTGGIIKVNPKTGKESKLSFNGMPVNAGRQFFNDPIGVAVDRKGKLFVADRRAFGGAGGIIKVNPKTGKESKFSANDMPVNAGRQFFDRPNGIAIDAKSRVLVGDLSGFGGTGGVIRVDRSTGKEKKLSANDMPVNTASQFFTAPVGLALNAAGGILLADYDAFGNPGGVIKVNQETGKESKLSANDMPVNAVHQLFADPVFLTVVPKKGRG